MGTDRINGGEGDSCESLDAMEEAIQDHVDTYNQTPQQALGGLSPTRLHRLLRCDWSCSTGPLVVHDSLLDAEATMSRVVRNARVFLSRALETGGLEATEAGNLKRAEVAWCLESMGWDPGDVESIRRVNKVINEQDVRDLHLLRVVLEVGECFECDGDRFRTTSRGERLSEPGRAESLWKHLFVTYFRDFNIAYFTRGAEWPELQHTAPFALYQLYTLEEGWHNQEALVDRMMLPIIEDRAAEQGEKFLSMHYGIRLLDPLVKFHLLETRRAGPDEPGLRIDQYRKTPLMDRALEFRWKA